MVMKMLSAEGEIKTLYNSLEEDYYFQNPISWNSIKASQFDGIFSLFPFSFILILLSNLNEYVAILSVLYFILISPT